MFAGFNKKLITEYLEPRMQNWNFHSKLVPCKASTAPAAAAAA
jgi:hypothetical protein